MPRLDSLFSFRHGDHACVFYSDLQSLLDVLTPYVTEGLRNNERCFCAQTPEVLRALTTDLQFLGIDTDREVRRGTLDLHTTEDVYCRDHDFVPEAMLDLLHRSIDDSVSQGFRGFRCAGDLCWAMQGRDESDRLVDYEQAVQAFYPETPAIAICQYPVDKFRSKVLERVTCAHSKTLDSTAPGATNASLRFRKHDCEAEIIRSKISVRPACHYVIHLPGGDMLWGNSPDVDDALSTVEELMASHSR